MVLDASVWVSVLLPQDAHHQASRRWLRRQTGRRQPVIVPTLALAEVAGAVTRRTGAPDLGRRSAEALLRVPGLRLMVLDADLGREAAAIAAAQQLRGGDAVYVATARRLNVSLITWDQELQTRAGALIKITHP